MWYNTYFPILILLCSVFISCEQVVNIDLNSASPRYVIEGRITYSSEPALVRITQSKNFDADNDFRGIDEAEIILSDDQGHSEVLAYADSGWYIGNEIDGIPGRRYSLSVTIEGETFTASTTMPQPVTFERLLVDSLSLFGETLKYPVALYRDPEEEENYYRHILYVNGEKKNSIFVSSDELYNGDPIERALRFGDPEDDLATGDTVVVEMQSIDKQVYEYFSTLTQTINRSAASPANPASNISGTALGYFSAHTRQLRATVVE